MENKTKEGMNKKTKDILEAGRKSARGSAYETYRTRVSNLLMRYEQDIGGVYLDVLIVDQCIEYTNLIKRIDENFDNAVDNAADRGLTSKE